MKALQFTILFASLAVLNDALAVEFSTVEAAGKRVTIYRVNVRQERLQLFHRNETGQPFKRFEVLAPWLKSRGQKLIHCFQPSCAEAQPK